MRSIKLATVVSAAMLLLVPLIVRSVEERKLSVFTASGHFTVSVTEFDRTLYVPLRGVLEQFGAIQVKADRNQVRIRLKDIEGEFQDNSTRVRIGRTVIRTVAPVLLHQGDVLVPMNVLPMVLKNYGAGTAEFHENGRRLFLSGAQQVVSTTLQPDGAGLVMEFPSAVNPKISSDGPKVRMAFQNEPVVLSVDRVDYTDKLIKSVSFLETNGIAEITVEGAGPLLANFSGGGRVITFTAAPAPAVSAAPADTQPPVAAPATDANVPVAPESPTPGQEQPAGTPSVSATPFLVMIDASHGGSETGVRFSETLLEKEITLMLAKRLQSELHERGIAATLLRSDDSTISADQRAVTVNEKRPALYVSLHAGGPGTGVRVYTALGPAETDRPATLFVRWEHANQIYVTRSRTVGKSVVTELAAKKINASLMPASVAPLNAIAAPAIAIEVAPPPSRPTVDALTTVSYQVAVVEATATGIAQARSKAGQAHAELKK
jgi:N-acetylmuramoyl-L-alanine amidase